MKTWDADSIIILNRKGARLVCDLLVACFVNFFSYMVSLLCRWTCQYSFLLVKGLWLCLRELSTECHSSHKHNQSHYITDLLCFGFEGPRLEILVMKEHIVRYLLQRENKVSSIVKKKRKLDGYKNRPILFLTL